MPLPLIPFAIKGLVVAGKFLASHATAAQAVAKATTTAVTTAGVATTASAAFTGCVVIGGVKFGIDTIQDAGDAFEALLDGDLTKASLKLAKVAKSIHSLDGDLSQELSDWLDNGANPYNDNFEDLVYEVHYLALQAKNDLS